MLSILIPVYNFEIGALVHDLHGQAIQAGIDFEIICFDDGSKEHFRLKNKPLDHLDYVSYHDLPENLGRSKIRNELAKVAQYESLLFMDCDSKVVSSYFIKNYIEAIEPKTLVYGGRVYNAEPPKEQALRFHWHYGTQREQVDYRERQNRPYHAFQTNNFLVPRDVFLEIQFDENLRQYGHEDTLFGFELKNRKIAMKHIDNPLEHIGLERVEVFLDKTRKGIENLKKVHQVYPFVETKLLIAYQRCIQFGLKYPLRFIFGMMRGNIEKKLSKDGVNLRWFDFYKLGLMVDIELKEKV